MVAAKVTWILLADGSGGRILANDGVGHGLSAVVGAVFSHVPRRDSDVYSDRPGRVHDSHGPGRHAAERPTSGAEQDRVSFAREIEAFLAARSNAGDYDRLIVAAPPAFLGHLRAVRSKAVAERVHAEIASDLTRADTAALVEALGKHIAL